MRHGAVALRSRLAGTGASLRLRHRHQATGAAFQGASDAEIQGALGEAAFRARRQEIPTLSQAVDRGMAPQTRTLDRMMRPNAALPASRAWQARTRRSW